MISMIAVVGAENNIGPRNGLPVFADPVVQNSLVHRAHAVTEGGVIVIGSHTARIMQAQGTRFNLMGGHSTHAIWSQSNCPEPAEFLDSLEATGRNVFICGGHRTFRTFAPFVENFFIWRAHLTSAPDFTLDPILSGWQKSPTSRPVRMQ